MQVNGVNVDKVSKEDVGIKINGIVRENDHVYKKVQIKDV